VLSPFRVFVVKKPITEGDFVFRCREFIRPVVIPQIWRAPVFSCFEWHGGIEGFLRPVATFCGDSETIDTVAEAL